MLVAADDIKSALEQLLPGVAVTVDALPAAPGLSAVPATAQAGAAQAGGALLVAPKDLAAVCRCLKEHERFGLDYLSNLTAVDYLPDPAGGARPGDHEGRAGGTGRIDIVYHLYSMAKKHGPLTVKVQLPRAHPVVTSVTPIWRGAEFQEREVYDLFGVTFDGHPDLRRLLMWEGFEGHPMRKDYVVEDQDAR